MSTLYANTLIANTLMGYLGFMAATVDVNLPHHMK